MMGWGEGWLESGGEGLGNLGGDVVVENPTGFRGGGNKARAQGKGGEAEMGGFERRE